MRHDGPGSNKGVATDSVATKNGGIRADGRASPHPRGFELMLAFNSAPRIDDVCEDSRGPTEDVIFEDNTVIEGDIILDLASIANNHVRTHVNVLSEYAVATDLGMFHDVTEMPDPSPLSDFTGIVDDGRFVSEIGLGSAIL